MINVNDVCFHGVTFTDWKYSNGMSDVELLENIFYDDYILIRGSLEKKHPFMYRSLLDGNLNDDDRVSICCHFDREKHYFYDGVNGMYFRDENSAFDKFIRNNLSIVLDKDVLNNYKYLRSGMIGEYQVCGDISLKYVRAIGLPNYFERICNDILKILYKDDLLDYQYNINVQKLKMARDMIKFLELGCNGYGYYEYDQIERLLQNFGYDIPIIDAESGLEWLSKDEMAEKVECVRDLAISKKLIRV